MRLHGECQIRIIRRIMWRMVAQFQCQQILPCAQNRILRYTSFHFCSTLWPNFNIASLILPCFLYVYFSFVICVLHITLSAQFYVIFEMAYQYFKQEKVEYKKDEKRQKKIVEIETFLTSIHIYFILGYFWCIFLLSFWYFQVCAG